MVKMQSILELGLWQVLVSEYVYRKQLSEYSRVESQGKSK